MQEIRSQRFSYKMTGLNPEKLNKNILGASLLATNQHNQSRPISLLEGRIGCVFIPEWKNVLQISETFLNILGLLCKIAKYFLKVAEKPL